MRVFFCTAGIEVGPKLARTLVEERLAACVNIVPKIRSIYTWQGKVEDEEECLLVVKTTLEAASRLRQRIRELHPYSVPEILALDVDEARSNPDYVAWVEESVSGKPGR